MLSTGANDASRTLEAFLTGSGSSLPPLDLLNDSGLAAYAAVHSDVQGPALRVAHITALTRHLAIRAQVAPLLRAWAGAGIEALVFKGFHLAEFVYPDPASRHYSDVDLLIRERQVEAASRLADEEGWEILWRAGEASSAFGRRRASYQGHELLQLRHRQSGARLDVHRRLVHNNHNHRRGNGRPHRITRLAWERSQASRLEGAPVRLLHPLDAVLVGLVLNRCWSPEDWRLRPHDYLDFKHLVERYSLTMADLRTRAAELGCATTFEIFLGRCNPFDGRCRLGEPSPLELQAWNLLISRERGNRYLAQGSSRVLELARAPLEIATALPSTLRVVLHPGREDPRRLALELMERGVKDPRTLSAEGWLALRRGTHRAFRCLGLGTRRHRDLQAVALLAGLRARSCPARLGWRTGGDGQERPFLELDGKPLNLDWTLLAS